jgi:chromosome segregation ATPase
MRNFTRIAALFAATALTGALVLAGTAQAQSGRIVCWKDKSGKVVGCGDKVPPEYQSSATRELDSRGVTRKQTESVEDANRRREQEQAAAKVKAEEDRKALDQKRQDTALLETYASEKEIDAKRDRDLQVLDLQIEQLTGALKNTVQRYNDSKGRIDALEKSKKPVPPPLKEEFGRVSAEKERFEQSIANKNKEKEELRVKYTEYRRRYTELRSQQTTAKK